MARMAKTKKTDAPLLNPEQQTVVEWHHGPLRVAAVAGSGKTTALVERVVHLVQARNVAPSRILMISFSKNARDQMQQRIDARLPGMNAGQCARTFHSLGLEIHKAETREAMTIDSGGLFQTMAINMAFQRHAIEPNLSALKTFSSRVKNGLLGAPHETLARLGYTDPRMMELAVKISNETSGNPIDASEMVTAYETSERIRTTEGVPFKGEVVRFVTFDDMLCSAARHLAITETRKRWSARWDFILQDEAQDENEAQNAIASALAKDHQNYMVVGDPSQSVFGFRGAEPERILSFHKDWPSARTVVMHRNYRSGIEIVDLANRVVGEMPADTVLTDDNGDVPDIVSERNTRAYVGVHSFPTDDDEGEAIAKNIQAHFDSGVPWEDQAVLLRMNAMTRPVELALAKAAIPYKLISGTSFFTMKEVRVFLGYLRVAARRANEDAFRDSIGTPSRMLGKTFVERVLARHEFRAPDHNWVEDALGVTSFLSDQQRQGLAAWAAVIEDLRRSFVIPWLLGTVGVLDKSGIGESLMKKADDGEDNKIKANIDSVMGFLRSHRTVDDLLDVVDQAEGFRAENLRKRKVVQISTVHKAKGAEWPVVYLCGMSRSLFPVPHAEETEERRLFYVATTRAMNELWISRPERSCFRKEDLEASSFLAEIDLGESMEHEVGRATATDVPAGSQMSLL